MRVIRTECYPYKDMTVHISMEMDREMFDYFKPRFLPVIKKQDFLGDYNPHIHGEWGNKYPNHPQFTLKLENGDEITIWTQHVESNNPPCWTPECEGNDDTCNYNSDRVAECPEEKYRMRK